MGSWIGGVFSRAYTSFNIKERSLRSEVLLECALVGWLV